MRRYRCNIEVVVGGHCWAVEAIHKYVESLVREAFPDADPAATATAMWALVHGLAILHLDGKFDASSEQAVAERVRAAVSAVLNPS